jgi:hypothetical protein
LDKKHCRSSSFVSRNKNLKKKQFILEIEIETINRDLEKQFNESLQSKILYTHHEGLGFHGNASISSNEHHQQFVPATTETRSSTKQNKSEL